MPKIQMHRKMFFTCCIICLSLLHACTSVHDDKLRIAVAANLQFVIGELTDEFFDETGIECELIVSSSGKLTAQIFEGAPYDLFLSADMKFPTELYNKGFTVYKPDIYAYGKLVLWTMQEGVKPELTWLSSEEVTYIALGNPKTAPYGLSAMEVIEHLGIKEALEGKLVFGESIAQTNQFIISKSVDLGFSSKSVVLSPRMKNHGSWTEIDKSLYSPMAQGMVVLKSREAFREKAILFREFLLSSKGKNILHKFGYDIEG